MSWLHSADREKNGTSNKGLIKWKYLIYIAPLRKKLKEINTQCVLHKHLIAAIFRFLLHPPHKQIKEKDIKLLENVY